MNWGQTLIPIVKMPPPRVIRVTRVDPSPRPSGEVKSRLRRVRGILDAKEEYPRRLASRWARPLFVLTFLAVAYCTLFPFNFKVPHGMTLSQAAAEWHWELYDPSDKEDWFENVILFLPFGFATACLSRSLGASRRWLSPIALGAAAIFSTSIEIFQLWLPTRDSSLADVLANTTGGFLGGASFAAWGTFILIRGGRSLEGLRRTLTLPVASALIALLCAVALIGPYHLRHRGRELASWDSKYVLVLGSEPNDISRSWRGTIYSLDLANGALNPADVERAYRGEPLSKLLPSGSIHYSYVPYGFGQYPERNNRGPALRWSGSKPDEGARTMFLSGDHFLVSTKPITQFNKSIAAGKTLTARAVLQTTHPYQNNQRIIAGILQNANLSNFTLMQDRADLLIHVRTLLSGNRPVWIVPDVFAQPGTHDVVITYEEPVLRVYVDAALRPNVVEAPADFYEVQRFTARFDRLPMKGPGLEIYRILYYFILFVPIGLLAGVIVTDPRTPLKIRAWIAVASLLAPLLLMQGMLCILDHRTPRADNFLLNLVLPLLAMTLMIWWLEPAQLDAGLRTAANVIRRRGR